MGEGEFILNNASFEIAQGQLVSVIGGRGSGKSTLLQLLGGVLVLPKDSGLLFMPPHGRVLHVSFDPMIFYSKTLMENLCFGPSDGADEDPERVKRICRRLGLNKDLLEEISEVVGDMKNGAKPGDKENHGGTARSVAKRSDALLKASAGALLSHTDRYLIHLARALVMNPEVLIIHKPLSNFDDLHGGRVLELLREFVDMRGVEKPVHGRRLQRPRTCIFSVSDLTGIKLVDRVLQIQGGKVEEADVAGLELMEQVAKELFAMLDDNGDGSVSRDEFIRLASTSSKAAELMGFTEVVANGNAEEVRKILGDTFEFADSGGSGGINFQELVFFLRSRLLDKIPTGTTEYSTKSETWAVPDIPLETRLPTSK